MTTFGQIPSNVPFSNFQVVANAAGRPGSPDDGDTIYQQDNNKMYAFDGTIWRLVTPEYQSGSGGVNDVGSSSVIPVTLTFSNPDAPVQIMAWCYVKFDSDSTTASNGIARIDIALDGGTAFNQGPDSDTGSSYFSTNSNNQGPTVTSVHYHAGTPSGDIKVRLAVRDANNVGSMDAGICNLYAQMIGAPS